MKHSFFTFLLAGTILSASALNVAAQTNASLNFPVGHEQKFDEAQMRKKMEEHHKKMAQKIAEDLKLTDEQRKKAETINENGRKDIEPMMKEMKNIREKMDEKRKLNLEEFEKILTPEQKEKFGSMKEEYKKKYIPDHKKHHDVEDRPWLKKKEHHGPKIPLNSKTDE